MKPTNNARLLVVITFCITLFSWREADARIPKMRDSLYALDASRVVIVRPDGTDTFRIEEILLDEAKARAQVGDVVTLPGFKLFTSQEGGPDLVTPMTAGSLILLYLKRKSPDSDTWIITQSDYAFFWIQDSAKVGELRNMGREALRIRAEWDAARSTPDEAHRIAALWPFLENYQGRFNSLAQVELQRIGTPAGDVLADRLEGMSSNQRMGFLIDLHLYRSERLHQFLIAHLRREQKLYEDFLKTHDKSLIDDWDTLPGNVQDIYGELYYGLGGLARFQDPTDLPLIRELALWAVKYRFKQTDDAALDAFRDMPEKANLPIIDAIWKEFSIHQHQGNEMLALDVTRALHTHRFPETVPVLAQFLDDKNKDFAAEAQSFLRELVGKDLGPNPKPWLDWYQAQQAK